MTAGYNNASTTFDGELTEATAGNLQLTKVGTGSLSLTGAASNFTGQITVYNGSLIYGGNAVLNGTNAPNVWAGGTLVLDNSVSNVTDRIPGGMGLNMVGGSLLFHANATGSSDSLALSTNTGGGPGAVGVNTIGMTAAAGGASSVTFASFPDKKTMGSLTTWPAPTWSAPPAFPSQTPPAASP